MRNKTIEYRILAKVVLKAWGKFEPNSRRILKLCQ